MAGGQGDETEGAPGLARKLGVKAGHLLVLVSAPGGWVPADLPAGARVERRRAGPAALKGAGDDDVVVAFFSSQSELRRSGPVLGRELPAAAALWVAWPRRAGGHQSDITDNVLREVLLPLGLVDVKVAALGVDWSGLRFVWRKELRAGVQRARTTGAPTSTSSTARPANIHAT